MIEYALDDLPYQTADLPGIGGQVKQYAEDFIVEELPLYPASGNGDHLYVTVRRHNMTTRTLQKKLADLFGLKEKDIGYAGMKDRLAYATQTFSLPGIEPGQTAAIDQIDDVELLDARLHTNKLKLGHLAGNRFTITIRLPADQIESAFELSQNIMNRILKHGVFNYFGPQRFGMHQDNHQHGKEIVRNSTKNKAFRANRWKSTLFISAYQSYLFNYYIKMRHESGYAHHLLDGDIARKADTGGLFWIDDAEAEQHRFERGEISYTGPLFGYKMMTCDDTAATLEHQILDMEKIELNSFRNVRTTGDRRPAVIYPKNASVAAGETGITLAFELPPGSYASVLIREIAKLKFHQCG